MSCCAIFCVRGPSCSPDAGWTGHYRLRHRLLAALLTTIPALTLLHIQTPLLTNTPGASTDAFITALTLLLLELAITLLGVASGAPASATVTSAPSPLPSDTFSLFTTNGHIAISAPPAAYVLLILPILALFLGGRVAARLAGAPAWTTRISNGAVIGTPYALLLTALSRLATLAFSTGAPNRTLTPIAIRAGLASGPTLLTALAIGTFAGALGGLSVPTRTAARYRATVPLPTAPVSASG